MTRRGTKAAQAGRDRAAADARHVALQAELASLTLSLAERSAQVSRLTQQLAALQAGLMRRDVRDQVDAAIKAGRLLPVMRDWALMLGAADPAGLTAFCGGPSLQSATKGVSHE